MSTFKEGAHPSKLEHSPEISPDRRDTYECVRAWVRDKEALIVALVALKTSVEKNVALTGAPHHTQLRREHTEEAVARDHARMAVLERLLASHPSLPSLQDLDAPAPIHSGLHTLGNDLFHVFRSCVPELLERLHSRNISLTTVDVSRFRELSLAMYKEFLSEEESAYNAF